MSSVPLIDNHKCPVFSKGHDWDGSTCLACGYTNARIYLERIAELEAQLTELREAAMDVVETFDGSILATVSISKLAALLEGGK